MKHDVRGCAKNRGGLEPERGDLIAFYPSSLPSLIISKVGKTKYCHIGIVLNKYLYISAVWNGISIEPISKKGEYDLFVIEGISEQDVERIVQFVLNWVGREYDFLGLFEYVTKLPLGHPGKFYCSELIATLLLLLGKDVPTTNLSPEEVTKLPYIKPKNCNKFVHTK